MHPITTRTPPSTLPRALVLWTLLSACAALQPALARERSTQVTGAKGQTVQRDTSRQEGDVNTTATGPQGQQWQRQVDRSKTGSTATVTGPQGQTIKRNTAASKSASASQ